MVVGLCGVVAVVVGFCVKTARHLSGSWIWIGKKIKRRRMCLKSE